MRYFSTYLVSDAFKSSLNLGNAQLVLWHLQHGADPRIRTRRGFTALDYAGYKYSLKLVKSLVQHGADVTKTTAIHNAVANSVKFPPVNPGRLDIVTYLLEYGASINQLQLTGDDYSLHRNTAASCSGERDSRTCKLFAQQRSGPEYQGCYGYDIFGIGRKRPFG